MFDGICNYVPSGLDPDEGLQFVGEPVFVGLPYLAAFLTPCMITIISYVTIWTQIRKVKKDVEEMKTTNVQGTRELTQQEISFIWTVFIICLCYLLCALPGIILVDIFHMKDGTTFLISLSLLWIQFSLNIFIYAYRSEQYRSAYWDLLVLMFPFLSDLKKKCQKNKNQKY